MVLDSWDQDFEISKEPWGKSELGSLPVCLSLPPFCLPAHASAFRALTSHSVTWKKVVLDMVAWEIISFVPYWIFSFHLAQNRCRIYLWEWVNEEMKACKCSFGTSWKYSPTLIPGDITFCHEQQVYKLCCARLPLLMNFNPIAALHFLLLI